MGQTRSSSIFLRSRFWTHRVWVHL
ncbi:UNVERIFIED_CONTAM: hypothetical protein GTU68_063802 [Idotea baltica]|nr:hypothetical protein [Idotea baltica]